MRHVYYVLLFPLLFGACISITLQLPEEPDCMVDYYAVCRQLGEDKDYETEIVSETIQSNDETVYAIIKVLNLSKTVRLNWHWFSPEKKRVKISKPLLVNKSNKFLQYFAAWDSLPNRYFKDQPGTWTVAVTCDDAFFYQFSFEIREVKSPEGASKEEKQ